jgi:hypothetical protein
MAGQFLDEPVPKQKLKELRLRHVGGELQIIEPAFAEFVDHIGLVVFEDDQIHDFISGSECGK